MEKREKREGRFALAGCSRQGISARRRRLEEKVGRGPKEKKGKVAEVAEVEMGRSV